MAISLRFVSNAKQDLSYFCMWATRKRMAQCHGSANFVSSGGWHSIKEEAGACVSPP